MYRFHPSVHWNRGYPNRNEIVSQVTQLWKRYGLDQRTMFNTKVTSVAQDKQGRWIINDPSNGKFDGVLAAVGTCGEPKMPHIPGQEKFKGQIFHSSRLDGKSAKGKKVLVIGGGASAVEALEFVVHTEAAQTNVLARSDKWIIPRNPLVDILLALNIFGEETILSWVPESLLRLFFYRDLKDLAPTKKGIFTDTPMVSTFLSNAEGLQPPNASVGQLRHLSHDSLRQGKVASGRHHRVYRTRYKIQPARPRSSQEWPWSRDCRGRRHGHHGHRLSAPQPQLPPRGGIQRSIPTPKLVPADLSTRFPRSVRDQFDIIERDRYGGKLPYRNIYAFTANVPR